MIQFDLDRYYSLFIARLKKAEEKSQIQSLQRELYFLDTRNERVTQLLKETESRLKSARSEKRVRKDGSDELDEGDVDNVDDEKVPSNDGCVVVKEKSDERNSLELQKINLLQMENLLTENMQKGDSSFDLVVKKMLLFNSNISTGESNNLLTDNDQTLEKDRHEQSKLSEILADKVLQVKKNAENFSHKLKSESSVLNTLEATVGDHSTKIEKEREKIKKISSSSWMTTIMIWGGLLLGLLIFLWAFLYMRLISPVKIKKIIQTTTVFQTPSSLHPESTTTASPALQDYDWDEL